MSPSGSECTDPNRNLEIHGLLPKSCWVVNIFSHRECHSVRKRTIHSIAAGPFHLGAGAAQFQRTRRAGYLYRVCLSVCPAVTSINYASSSKEFLLLLRNTLPVLPQPSRGHELSAASPCKTQGRTMATWSLCGSERALMQIARERRSYRCHLPLEDL